MAPMATYSNDASGDIAFSKAMHGKSAEERNAFMSMLRKDGQAHRIVTDDYLKYWQIDGNDIENTEEARDSRKKQYTSLVNK